MKVMAGGFDKCKLILVINQNTLFQPCFYMQQFLKLKKKIKIRKTCFSTF